MRIGSLFSGIGGLELGLEMAGLGETVWQVERDPYALKILARHWPRVERHTDVTTFDARQAGAVDLVCGGFPCQPWSVAGRQRGAADERHLWPAYARIVEEARPAIVVAENVPGLRKDGLPIVLADLARLGFDAEWACLSAEDVGAPHRRRRLFIVATHPERVELRDEPGWLSRACGAARAAIVCSDGRAGDVADADGEGQLQQGGAERPLGRRPGHGRRPSGAGAMAHADGARLEVGREQPARQEQPAPRGGGPPPRGAGAIEPGVRRGYDGPASWLDGSWERGIPRTAHGVPSRADRLKCLGNAVVPACAEVIGRAIAATCRLRTA